MERVLVVFFSLFCVLSLWAQGGGGIIYPGQIYESASSAGPGGDGVLDPDGDGWITLSGTTFSTYPTITDESEEFEESGWTVIFHHSIEPTSDLETGSNCGATEIVDNPNSGKQAAYYRLVDVDSDPSNRNEFLQFRVRIAQKSTGAFGFSILLDTDQTFGNTGSSPDANYVSGNPGFEVEILVGTGGGNSGVTMQNVDGVTSGFTELEHFNAGVRDQWSYARFSNCTEDDPIYADFYVNFSSMPVGVTALTPLRMVFASSSSPSTALGGSASDIGGVDDNAYSADDDAFTVVVESTPTLSFSGGYACDDVDADGICDDVDDCVGAYDACGVCNGPGAIYECGCADIPEGDCDCDGNQLDALGVCGGDCAADANGNGVCEFDHVDEASGHEIWTCACDADYFGDWIGKDCNFHVLSSWALFFYFLILGIITAAVYTWFRRKRSKAKNRDRIAKLMDESKDAVRKALEVKIALIATMYMAPVFQIQRFYRL